jgi:hypothetical protein
MTVGLPVVAPPCGRSRYCMPAALTRSRPTGGFGSALASAWLSKPRVSFSLSVAGGGQADTTRDPQTSKSRCSTSSLDGRNQPAAARLPSTTIWRSRGRNVVVRFISSFYAGLPGTASGRQRRYGRKPARSTADAGCSKAVSNGSLLARRAPTGLRRSSAPAAALDVRGTRSTAIRRRSPTVNPMRAVAHPMTMRTPTADPAWAARTWMPPTILPRRWRTERRIDHSCAGQRSNDHYSQELAHDVLPLWWSAAVVSQ